MNEDVDKVFPCKENDCHMSFYNEHQLSVHEQLKHSKLNLEIPTKDATINFTDQTPTPTTILLNHCEELRVFDDLKNINPFDEDFRQAISDDNRRDSSFLSAPSNQDTLHTPQILPDFIARTVKDEILNSTNDEPIQTEPENLSTTPEIVANIPRITLNEEEMKVSRSHPIPLLPKSNIIYAAPILPASAAIHSNKSNESVKDKLKNIILSNTSTNVPVNESKRIKLNDNEPKVNLPAILIGTMPLIAAPAKLIINNNNNNNNSSSSISKNTYAVISSDTEVTKPSENGVKRKTNGGSVKPEVAALKVERNRAAARRYRHKMKIQGQALRDKYEKALKEIASLKKEMTDLKQLLLLHKDCEVTRNLKKN